MKRLIKVLLTVLFGRPEIDHQLERRGLLDGEIGGLGAFQNLVHVGGGAPMLGAEVRPVAHEPASLDVFAEGEHGWKLVLQGQLSDQGSRLVDGWTRADDQRLGSYHAQPDELIGQFAGVAKAYGAHLQANARGPGLPPLARPTSWA